VTPDAWRTPEPEWVTLAPGVRWLLQRPNGVDERVVAAETAATMARVYEGRAALQDLGVDVDDPASAEALDLERLSGFASVFAACLHARRGLKGWEGIDDPTTGEPLDHTDPATIRAALVYGAPPSGTPLLTPFLAWLQRPQRPMAAEATRLRARARDWFGGGAERCRACADEKTPCSMGGAEPSADDPSRHELCPQRSTEPQTPEGQAAWRIAVSAPGLWSRAGMSGTATGLDHGAALIAFEAECASAGEACDHGAAFAAFRAIEAGALEAFAAKAEADAAVRAAKSGD
jgi:hypothetical protein